MNLSISLNGIKITIAQHAAADCYFERVSGLDDAEKARINGFVNTLDAAGVLSALRDACFLRRAQNNGTNSPATLKGVATGGTITGAASIEGEGALTDGSTAHLDWTVPDSRTGTLAVAYRGHGTQGGDGAIALASLCSATGHNAAASMTISGAGACRVRVQTREGTAESTSGTIDRDGLGFGASAYDPEPHTLIVANDNAATPALTAWVDGNPNGFGSMSTTQVTTPCTRLFLGAKWESGSTYSWRGRTTFSAWALFDRVLTDEEAAAVDLAFRWLDPAEENVVFMGDSLTAYTDDNEAESVRNYPHQLMSRLGWRGVKRGYNCGFSGVGAGNALARYARQVQPFRPRGPVKRADLLVLLGANDARKGVESPAATIYAQLKQIWALARADGFTVHAITLPAGSTVWYEGTSATIREDFNDMVIETPPGLVASVIRADLVLPDGSDTAKFADGLHPTAEGYGDIANHISSGRTLP